MTETRFLLSKRDNRHAAGYGSPGVRWWGYQGRRKPITCIVLHTAETPATSSSARAVAEWQSRADRPSSYHVIVDSQWTMRTVRDQDTAFHVADFNSGSLGLSWATRASDWNVNRRWDGMALARAAAVARQWQALYDIPRRWLTRPEAMRGIKGFVRHSTMDPARRSDPGLKFPADTFFQLLDDQGADMTPEESARLKRVEELLEHHFGDDARDRRPSAWRDLDVTKQSQGRTEEALAGLPSRVAAEVTKSLPAGTVDVDQLADRVADVIFARAGKA